MLVAYGVAYVAASLLLCQAIRDGKPLPSSQALLLTPHVSEYNEPFG